MNRYLANNLSVRTRLLIAACAFTIAALAFFALAWIQFRQHHDTAHGIIALVLGILVSAAAIFSYWKRSKIEPETAAKKGK